VRNNPNFRGILFILASGIFLSINDSVYKFLVPHYPPGQILFIGGASVSILTLFIIRFTSETGVIVNNWRAHVARGLLFTIASFAFVISLRYLTLAETICIAFSGPLFMTLMARYFLKEQVGLYRLMAVLAGFLGVIIIIQPGTSEFRWVLLLPLLVALGDAARDVLTRKIAHNESSLSIVFTTSVVLALVSLLSLESGWNTLRNEHVALFGVSAILTVISYFCMVEAYRNAPAVVIAPFRYIQILWGMLAGIVVFGEVPAVNLYIGVVFIVGAGFVIAIRESRIREPN
jgi:drug/metabolite transporter (DMT)-like permease